MRKGWYGESNRHSLARQGIKTSVKTGRKVRVTAYNTTTKRKEKVEFKLKPKKYYVLYEKNSPYAVIVSLDHEPTEKEFGEKYGFAESGFKTKKDAENRIRMMNQFLKETPEQLKRKGYKEVKGKEKSGESNYFYIKEQNEN